MKNGGSPRLGFSRDTPLKTNMSPENQWLQDVFRTERVLRGHVSFRGCIHWCCFRGLLFQKTCAEGLTFLRGQSC